MKISQLRLALTFHGAMLLGASCAQEVGSPQALEPEEIVFKCEQSEMLSFAELKEIEQLPNPFLMMDGTRVISKEHWDCRRTEIKNLIQHYETGVKPEAPDNLSAMLEGENLTITVTNGGKKLDLTAVISIPDGDGPFPAVIGIGFGGGTGSLPSELFTDRGIATIQYNLNEVAPWGFEVERGVGGFYELYPDPSVGFFTAWSWGVSRVIDAVELLPELAIDLDHLAITGCSFAGKISLFSAAFDERIALTIAQEPGGGGAAPWRVTETLDGEREILSRAQGAPWYSSDLRQFNSNVNKLPFDHHQLLSLIAPRALLVLGNPDFEWLAEESTHVGCEAAKTVWQAMGVPDRIGYSIVDGHQHCQLPESQYPEVIAFIERYLMGESSIETEIAISPYSPDLTKWITWSTPVLSE